MAGSPDRTTLLAFIGIVVLGGVNGTAIRLGNAELGPFWGATLRFGLAAIVLFAILAVRRYPVPHGKALLGSVLYGLLAFGVTFSLVNWALVETPAGLAQVILSLVPLLTLLLATAHGAERFRFQSLAGSLVSIVGVVLVFGERIGGGVPVFSLVAVLLAALSISEANVLAKRLPRCHPVANNAIGMSAGALLLLLLTLFSGEALVIPERPQTLLAVGYLALVGSVIVFSLYLMVIQRWTASATSYALLLMPLVSVVVAALVLNEPITPVLLLGGALVLAGVYLGAFAATVARPLPGVLRRPTAVEATAGPKPSQQLPQQPPQLVTPHCP